MNQPQPLIVGLAVAVAALAIIGWRRPLAALKFALTPRTLILIGAAALLTARLAESQPPLLVMIIAFSSAAIISLLSRMSEVGRARKSIRELRDPDRRDAARRFLTAWAKDTQPQRAGDMRWYAPIVCSAAGQLIAADLTDDACEMLARLPAALPDPRASAARTTLLAMAHLSLGRHAEAEAALAEAPPEVEHTPSKRLLDGARALLCAVEGKADEALAAATAFSLMPEMHGLVLAVEAHARAQRGEAALAKAALGQLREAGGRQALDRVVAQRGPASALAAAELAISN